MVNLLLILIYTIEKLINCFFVCVCVFFPVQQRIFHQNHPQLSVDEYKVSETDLPSSQQEQQQQRPPEDTQPHPKDKSLWAVTYNSMVNVNHSFNSTFRSIIVQYIDEYLSRMFLLYSLGRWLPKSLHRINGGSLCLCWSPGSSLLSGIWTCTTCHAERVSLWKLWLHCNWKGSTDCRCGSPSTSNCSKATISRDGLRRWPACRTPTSSSTIP